jgi:hypothetical protein
MQATTIGNLLRESFTYGDAFSLGNVFRNFLNFRNFLKYGDYKRNGGLLLLKKSPPNLLLPTDYPKGENGLWAPLDLLKCTSSANTDAIPDGWGPKFEVVKGAFPGNSLSLSLPVFISGSILSPVRVFVPFSCHILLT